MERLVAVRIRDNKRYGNWSGTGTGKTLSAVLVTRVVNANLTGTGATRKINRDPAVQVRNSSKIGLEMVRVQVPITLSGT